MHCLLLQEFIHSGWTKRVWLKIWSDKVPWQAEKIHHHTCTVLKICRCITEQLPSLKLTARTWKWMVGIRSFPFGMANFQVRTVSFRECNRIYRYLLMFFMKLRDFLSPAYVCEKSPKLRKITWQNHLRKVPLAGPTRREWGKFHPQYTKQERFFGTLIPYG